jgi:hypothetical protein
MAQENFQVDLMQILILKVLELMIIRFGKCKIELQTFSLQDLQIDYYFVSMHHCYNLMLGSSKPAIKGECKDIKGSSPATCQKIKECNG